jgi:hypothetical protein
MTHSRVETTTADIANPVRTKGATGRLILGVILAIFFSCLPSLPGAAETPVTVGYVEDVVLLPWGIRLPARIDTGASMTSLDARNIVVKEQTVSFKLPEAFGDRDFEMSLVRWGKVSSSMGVQRRPVVEMELCVGSQKLTVTVNLNNRSGVRYPLVIGRNLLRQGFVVNPEKKNLLPPVCEGARPK